MAYIDYLRPLALALLLGVMPATTLAHGGVVEENDLCVIRIGYLKAHFKIYLPQQRGHRQFCEDIPARGEAVFVMEYQHDDLSDATIEFRIIRNVTGKGKYARLEDINAIADLDAATISYTEPAVSPDVFLHAERFDEDGEYVGILRVARAVDDKIYTAVFPFDVGHTGFGAWPIIIALLLLLQASYWIMNRHHRRRTAPAACALMVIALAPGFVNASDTGWVSAAGHYRVSYTSSLDPVAINTIHSWILHIETSDGEPIRDAKIEVAGGMPKHNHGLPTRPRVVEEIGEGDYRVEGMRFHMHGAWEVRLFIDSGNARDSVIIKLDL